MTLSIHIENTTFRASKSRVKLLLLLSQLEESNKTLTKDVENLSKEKAELDEKLSTQEEGILNTLVLVILLCSYMENNMTLVFFFFLSEFAARREEILSSMKASYEKILNTERTLKTQVTTPSLEPH